MLARPTAIDNVVTAANTLADQLEKLVPKAMGFATLNWPGGGYFSDLLQVTHGQSHQVMGVIAVPYGGGVGTQDYIVNAGPGASASQIQLQGATTTHAAVGPATTQVFWIAFGSV